MKAKLLLIVILGLFFLNPHLTPAASVNGDVCQSRSVKAAFILVNHSLTSNAFFTENINDSCILAADVDIDDEDDSSVSSGRKNLYAHAHYFGGPNYSFSRNCISTAEYFSSFYHLPDSHFISLRVFKL